MKKVFIIIFIFCSTSLLAQKGFEFKNNKKKIVVHFQLINNLIFVPIKVNDVELNFLLDTGVDETILFSLEDKDEVRFYNIEKIKLKGLGTDKPIEALKSTGNNLSLLHLEDINHELYIVLDQDINFSSQIGIPVNGIIGYNFFKNHVVEINYDRKKITIYEPDHKKLKKKAAKLSRFDISIENNKPYIISSIDIEDHKDVPVKLLIDSGNTDAIWLFENVSDEVKIPQKNFTDFLGRGFSGDIFGKRARVTNFRMGDFNFELPIVAFPDASSLANVNFVSQRAGSIGAEITRRFTTVFDYKNSKMYLSKGENFDSPFNYNMSGIEVQHQGLQWVQETIELNAASFAKTFDMQEEKIKSNFKYKFILKPVYSISNIRKDSPADLSGLKKGDVIISVNRLKAYRYSLQQITSLLKSEDGKFIELEVERDEVLMKFRFQLKNIL